MCPSTLAPSEPFVPHRTGDGSSTLRSADGRLSYHSVHGAVAESTHVFINAGLVAGEEAPVRVFEVGLGTGLNMLLTWIRCLEGKCAVEYTALEPFPLTRAQLEALDHCEELAWPGLKEPFLDMMTAPSGHWQEVGDGMRFRWFRHGLFAHHDAEAYDVVYFDAFAPGDQPELWTGDAFLQVFSMLRPGGRLVTFCAKGSVRRNMIAAGLRVERLAGPPGKREMLRAWKPG